jgi:hypothetical protein
MNQEIKNLLCELLPSLASLIETETEKPIIDFKNDLYPRLMAIDTQIPGVGMQYVIWDDETPDFPFSSEFDGIIRGLSYVPYLLAGVSYIVASRWVTDGFNAHVDECVKKFCAVKKLRIYKTPGARAYRNRSYIGQPLTSNILRLYHLSSNVGKHKYHTGSPESVIPIQNSLACYFIARHLGASILQRCNRLDALMQAIKSAHQQDCVYNKPRISKR